MEKLRLVLNKIQDCIEMQNGATESQLKAIWNDISDYVSDTEREGKADSTSEKDLRVCEVIASYSSPVKVAVICLSQEDFLNHEKDSSKDYYPVWGRSMMLGCEFNEIEFTEKSKRNKWLSEIVNSCELRLI